MTSRPSPPPLAPVLTPKTNTYTNKDNDPPLIRRTFYRSEGPICTETWRGQLDNGLLVQVVLRGETVDFAYDRFDRLILQTQADTLTGAEPRVTRLHYHGNGEVSIDGPRDDVNDVRQLTFDENGNLVTFVNAAGHRYLSEYDDQDRPIGWSGPNGERREFQYDEQGWLAEETAAPGTAHETKMVLQFDEAGLLIESHRNNGLTIRRSYDEAGRLAVVSSSDGGQLRLLYAAGGLVIAPGASGQVMSGAGVVSGQVRQQELPGSVHWDALRVAGGQTRASRPVRQQHDHLGRVVAAYAADGSVTRYGYNGFGEVVAEQNASGGTAHYGYDAGGNRTWEQRTDGAVIYREFDALDRMVSMRRQRPGMPAETFRYRYDDCAHGVGRLCEASGSAGSTRFEYNIHGSLIRVETVVDGRAEITQFRYDANNHTEALIASSAVAQRGAPVIARHGQVRATAPPTSSSAGAFVNFYRSTDCSGISYWGVYSLTEAWYAGFWSFSAPATVTFYLDDNSTISVEANVCFQIDAHYSPPPPPSPPIVHIPPQPNPVPVPVPVPEPEPEEEEEEEEENDEPTWPPVTHDYAVDNKVCSKTETGCKLDNIACWLRHYHAPGKDSYDSPANHGEQVSLDLGWPFNREPVQVAVGPKFGLSKNAIAQIPLEGHPMHNDETGEWGPGADGCPKPADKTEGEDRPDHCNQVYREVYEKGGNIHVATRGTGNSGIADIFGINQSRAPDVFEDLDEDMIGAFESRTWRPGQEPPSQPPDGPLP